MTQASDPFHLDPERLPRRLQLELPAHIADLVASRSAETGRSESEIILELLDAVLAAEAPPSGPP